MISIVIPAYNEEKNVANCLDSLVKQDTKRLFEVIIVNNASTDKTSFVAQSYRNKLNLKVILEKQKGRGAAREAGFRIAAGEIILSTDADAILPFFWIDKLSDALYSGNAVAVTGFCRIGNCDWFTNYVINFMQPVVMKTYMLLYRHYWLSGFNFGIWNKIYKNTDGFDRNLNSLEDVDLSFKVCKLGKIKLLPEATVTVSGRRFKNGLIKESIPYFSTFLKYYYFKDRKVLLSDIRN